MEGSTEILAISKKYKDISNDLIINLDEKSQDWLMQLTKGHIECLSLKAI